MKILSVECSASPASAAVTEDEKLLAFAYTNVKMTHSQTLLPMVESVLSSAGLKTDDIDALAVAAGPGSFTGVRIGISAIKGLAAPRDIPCVPVSSLYGMAQNFRGQSCIVCAVMDARCNQVYNALFKIEGKTVTRLCEDRAVMCDELRDEIYLNYADCGVDIIVTGDGAELFYPYIKELNNSKKSFGLLSFQNAAGIAFAASEAVLNGNTVNADKLLPVYLRLPQAERELKKRESGK